MSLPLLVLIALLQFYVSFLVDLQLFDYEAFLYGNLQIIAIMWFYKTINKYIKF